MDDFERGANRYHNGGFLDVDDSDWVCLGYRTEQVMDLQRQLQRSLAENARVSSQLAETKTALKVVLGIYEEQDKGESVVITGAKLARSIQEAERFLVAAKAAQARLILDGYGVDVTPVVGNKNTGAVRRASLDLTRTLAELRSSDQ